jgi:hypothetical protein
MRIVGSVVIDCHIEDLFALRPAVKRAAARGLDRRLEALRRRLERR